MSFLDRIAAAVAPAASDEDRMDARQKVEELARGEPWLATIVDQHKMIESRFAACFAATPADRPRALKDLAAVLNGHSLAEEIVLYPSVADEEGKTKAAMAYEEQAMTKVQMAKLEQIDPASPEWEEKLDHIKSAVEQHVYQEENSWFPGLIESLPSHERQRLGVRFEEEYSRYAKGAELETSSTGGSNTAGARMPASI